MNTFHPQRNWKLSLALTVGTTTVQVSSSKELKEGVKGSNESTSARGRFHPQRNWKENLETDRNIMANGFILKGIESLSSPSTPFRIPESVSSSKELKVVRGFRNTYYINIRFHPQRNWKIPLLCTGLEWLNKVSSSKELKGYPKAPDSWILTFIVSSSKELKDSPLLLQNHGGQSGVSSPKELKVTMSTITFFCRMWFHPQRDWKNVSASNSSSHVSSFHPERNWKTVQFPSSIPPFPWGDVEFHPQRNWKINIVKYASSNFFNFAAV